jgi:predicted phosphodiesterase
MKIGVLSDTHDALINPRLAVETFTRAEVEALLHAARRGGGS